MFNSKVYTVKDDSHRTGPHLVMSGPSLKGPISYHLERKVDIIVEHSILRYFSRDRQRPRFEVQAEYLLQINVHFWLFV